MINNFSILISNTSRSISYLKELKKENLKPNLLIYLNDESNNLSSKIIKKKRFFFPKSSLKIFISKKVNDKISSFILKRRIKYLIYSGYPGEIIKNQNLLKKLKIIHCHPGKLPEFRGSTTIYYSFLKTKKIHCSSIVLNKDLDKGKILLTKRYPLPNTINTIDRKYDDKIRAMHLIKTIKNLKNLRTIKQNAKKIPYFTIHPVLRSICFNLKI